MTFFGTKKKTKKHDWRAIGAGIFYSLPTTDLILWVGSGGGGDRDNWEWRRRRVSSSIWRVPKFTIWARWTWSTCTGESRRGFYLHSTSLWLINSCFESFSHPRSAYGSRLEKRTSNFENYGVPKRAQIQVSKSSWKGKRLKRKRMEAKWSTFPLCVSQDMQKCDAVDAE